MYDFTGRTLVSSGDGQHPESAGNLKSINVFRLLSGSFQARNLVNQRKF